MTKSFTSVWLSKYDSKKVIKKKYSKAPSIFPKAFLNLLIFKYFSFEVLTVHFHCRFFPPPSVNSFADDIQMLGGKCWITSRIQPSTDWNSNHDSQCAWTCGFRWLPFPIVLKPPDSHGSSVISLFFKHVSTPFSLASWNPGFWARFSIEHVQLGYIVYAPGSDTGWEIDSLYRIHGSIQGHGMGIQNSGSPSDKATRKLTW